MEDLAWVRGLARRLAADEHTADEVAQETLIAAWASERRGESPGRAWLVGAVRNFLLHRRRSARRRSEREHAAARAESLPPVDAALAELEAHRRLMAAVAELDEALRVVVVLRYVDGLPPREIARILEVSPALVSHRLTNAMRQLRARLERDGGREGWLGAIAPLCFGIREGPWWPLGVLALNSKLLVASAVLLLGGAAWIWWPQGERSTQAESQAAFAAAQPERADASTSNDADALKIAREDVEPLAEAPRASESAALAIAMPPPPRSVAGRVFACDGQALPGVLVGVRGAVERARSGAGGWFELPVEGASGVLDAFDARWITVGAGAFSPATSATPIVLVAEAFELAGQVIDERGMPLEGARVSLVRPRAFEARFDVDLEGAQELSFRRDTDAQGRFRFEEAPSIDGAALRVVLDGFAPFEVAAPRATSLEVVVVLSRPKVAAEGKLAGIVLTPERRPAARARVAMGLTSALTDDEGRFELELARAVTTDELRAVKEGFLPARMERPFEPRGDSGWPEHVEVLLPGPAFALQGVVLDRERKPVAGARISLADPTRFGSIGRMPASVEALAAGALVPPEAIASVGQAPAEDGEHFWDYYSQPGPPTACWNWVRSDAQGRFELSGLCGRAYRLKVQLDDSLQIFVTEPIDAREGRAEIVMPEPDVWPRLAGRLVGPNDEPIANAQLQLQVEAFGVRSRVFGGSVYITMRQPGASATTDAEGRFEFRDVVRGDLRLTVRGDGLVPSEHELGGVGDPLALRLVADTRCNFELELAEPVDRADAVLALDAEGRGLDLLRIRGSSVNAVTEVELVRGRSGVHAVSSRCRTLVLSKNGQEVGRMSVQLRGAAPVRLRW